MTHKYYRRPVSRVLEQRLTAPRQFIQIVLGPRQVGKTTLVRQALTECGIPHVAVSADDLDVTGRSWLDHHWNRARNEAYSSGVAVISIDEIQKIPDWSVTVKRLWDEDTANGANVHVVLTGSSTTLIRKGMSESLAGRFEVLRATHWTFPEMRDAFGCSLEDFLVVGGYPGPMLLRQQPERWLAYMRESIVESTLALDVLTLERVDKPALLRNLFILGTSLSAQIVSLQKLLGQLQDSGNAATIAQYLSLLADAGLLCGLEKYTATTLRSRASSPKLQCAAPALLSAIMGISPSSPSVDPAMRGQIVESTVGSHLWSITTGRPAKVMYWREGTYEVDFVLALPRKTVLVEVKSGGLRGAFRGAEQFRTAHGNAPLIVVGAEGMSLERFLSSSLDDLLS